MLDTFYLSPLTMIHDHTLTNARDSVNFESHHFLALVTLPELDGDSWFVCHETGVDEMPVRQVPE